LDAALLVLRVFFSFGGLLTLLPLRVVAELDSGADGFPVSDERF
jgi:hypothetical protein